MNHLRKVAQALVAVIAISIPLAKADIYSSPPIAFPMQAWEANAQYFKRQAQDREWEANANASANGGYEKKEAPSPLSYTPSSALSAQIKTDMQQKLLKQYPQMREMIANMFSKDTLEWFHVEYMGNTHSLGNAMGASRALIWGFANRDQATNLQARNAGEQADKLLRKNTELVAVPNDMKQRLAEELMYAAYFLEHLSRLATTFATDGGAKKYQQLAHIAKDIGRQQGFDVSQFTLTANKGFVKK